MILYYVDTDMFLNAHRALINAINTQHLNYSISGKYNYSIILKCTILNMQSIAVEMSPNIQ